TEEIRQSVRLAYIPSKTVRTRLDEPQVFSVVYTHDLANSLSRCSQYLNTAFPKGTPSIPFALRVNHCGRLSIWRFNGGSEHTVIRRSIIVAVIHLLQNGARVRKRIASLRLGLHEEQEHREVGCHPSHTASG